METDESTPLIVCSGTQDQMEMLQILLESDRTVSFVLRGDDGEWRLLVARKHADEALHVIRNLR
jgi:hypothetical protein